MTFAVVLTIPFLISRSSSIHGGKKVAPYEQTPMCNAEGKCGEEPRLPSPRTVYSSKTRDQYDRWWKAHAALNRSAAEYVRRRNGDPRRAPPLVLLGDSITESWLGTDMTMPTKRAEGIPSVFREFFGTRFDPLVLAIGGDQTQHLLWRMDHGEVPPAVAVDSNVTFVVLIGTNNLGSGILPEPTALGVVEVAKYLLSNTRGKLVLVQLLPRGDAQRLARLCPPRCNSHGDPFESFMPAVNKVNSAVERDARELSKRHGGRLKFVDCGRSFRVPSTVVTGDAAEVNETLMPDRLHPNAAGHRILAECILDCLDGKC